MLLAEHLGILVTGKVPGHNVRGLDQPPEPGHDRYKPFYRVGRHRGPGKRKKKARAFRQLAGCIVVYLGSIL